MAPLQGGAGRASSPARPRTWRPRTKSARRTCGQAGALRARRGARRFDRLGEDGRRDPEAAGRVEDDRSRQPRPREGGLGALPRRVRSLLHPPAGGPEAPQGRVGRRTWRRRKRSARRPKRSPIPTDWDATGLAAETSAGRVEDDRSGPEIEVGSGLAALPRRVRSVLRSLQAPRPGRAAAEGRRARLDHSRARGAAAARRRRRRATRPTNLYATCRTRGPVAAGAGSAAPAPAGSGRPVSPGRRPS